ncbi:MAG: hypothetical protein H0W78_08595 [Planctomycetes bacterium]|nr:hypothetical protein [Planctomycetota bacterium]
MNARIQAIGLGFATILLVGAGLLSSSRDAVMPDLIRSALPEPFRPYVEGVTIDHDREGQPFVVPLSVRLVFEQGHGIVAILHNQGEAAFTALSAACRSNDGSQDTFDLGELAGGAEARIDSDLGWSFVPGESLIITVDDRHIIRLRVP